MYLSIYVTSILLNRLQTRVGAFPSGAPVDKSLQRLATSFLCIIRHVSSTLVYGWNHCGVYCCKNVLYYRIGTVRKWERIRGHTTLSVMTFSIMTVLLMTVSIMTVSIMTVSIMTVSIMKVSIMTVSTVINKNVRLSITKQHRIRLRCCNASFLLNAANKPFILSVVMLNAVMPSVVAPKMYMVSIFEFLEKNYAGWRGKVGPKSFFQLAISSNDRNIFCYQQVLAIGC